METPKKGGQPQTALHIALLTTVWKDYIKRDVFFQVYDFHEKNFNLKWNTRIKTKFVIKTCVIYGIKWSFPL